MAESKSAALPLGYAPTWPQGGLSLAESGPDNSSGSSASQWRRAILPPQMLRVPAALSGKRPEVRVGAANENADPLVRFWPVGAAGDRREGRRAARLGDDRKVGPEAALGLGDRRVLDQDDLAHELPGDGEIEVAHPL